VEGQNFGPEQSLILVTVLVICGTRMLLGAAIAGVLYTVLPGYIHSFTVDEQTLAFGLAAIVASVVLARREGLGSWLRRSAKASEYRLSASPVRARSRIRATAALRPEAPR
jgi:ABC-type branched-subunit amino acid transport system permease subunit